MAGEINQPQTNFQKLQSKGFLINLLVVMGICFALYFLFFASLSWITGHGNETVVPKLMGKSAKEAVAILEKAGFDIQVDSTFDATAKPLTVLMQQPEEGMTVKQGRLIFLTVNKATVPKIAMPNLIGLTLRSAELMLKSNRLELGDTSYRADIASGSVLAQQWANGKDITTGTMIPQGTKVNLVIGAGLEHREIAVPRLVGMTYLDAIALLGTKNLQYMAVFDDQITDTATAVVYSQMPEPETDSSGISNRILEGDIMDLRIRQRMPKSGE